MRTEAEIEAISRDCKSHRWRPTTRDKLALTKQWGDLLSHAWHASERGSVQVLPHAPIRPEVEQVGKPLLIFHLVFNAFFTFCFFMFLFFIIKIIRDFKKLLIFLKTWTLENVPEIIKKPCIKNVYDFEKWSHIAKMFVNFNQIIWIQKNIHQVF